MPTAFSIFRTQKLYDFKFTKGRADDKGGLDPQTIKKHAAIFRSVLSDALLKGNMNAFFEFPLGVPISITRSSIKIENDILK